MVSYDGEPKFDNIDGAKGLHYAINSALPVIRVDEDKTCWCVSNGVWFTAKSPLGPWAVATAVPAIIYTIPLTSPIHYVTYVRVYGSTSEVVYVGYTPGYMGTCVTADGVVVYGTGYYYPAYVGTTVWVGYPPTYGYGAGLRAGGDGVCFGFAAGAIIGDCWCHPYWGPCWGYGSIDINSSSVYRNWRGGVTASAHHYEYDAWSGKSLRTGGGAYSTRTPGALPWAGTPTTSTARAATLNSKGAARLTTQTRVSFAEAVGRFPATSTTATRRWTRIASATTPTPTRARGSTTAVSTLDATGTSIATTAMTAGRSIRTTGGTMSSVTRSSPHRNASISTNSAARSTGQERFNQSQRSSGLRRGRAGGVEFPWRHREQHVCNSLLNSLGTGSLRN